MLKHLLTYIVFALSYLCMGAYNYNPSFHQQEVTDGERYTIVHDYLGTPVQAYDAEGNLVWEMLLDVYGRVMESRGDLSLVPFRYQGQYQDAETGLYYNRFRYYSPQMGMYISSDPIGLAGNNPTLYGYVKDVNIWLDPFGLDLRRPYIRKSVRISVEQVANIKNDRFMDANDTEKAIPGGKRRKYSIAEGQYHLGHKNDHEFWREKTKAEAEGLTQKQFNDRMNDPNLYQIEDPHENMSHKHENPKRTGGCK